MKQALMRYPSMGSLKSWLCREKINLAYVCGWHKCEERVLFFFGYSFSCVWMVYRYQRQQVECANKSSLKALPACFFFWSIPKFVCLENKQKKDKQTTTHHCVSHPHELCAFCVSLAVLPSCFCVALVEAWPLLSLLLAYCRLLALCCPAG